MRHPRYTDQRLRARLFFLARAIVNTLRPRCPSRPTKARGGTNPAYGHWRCERHRGHDGPHRFVNYVWYSPDETHHVPVPVDLVAVTRLT